MVVTRNAGVDFTDGEAGIYVPERDSAAIADALVTICSHRKLRADMSMAAKKRAALYDDAAWEAHFIRSISGVVSLKADKAASTGETV